MVEEKKKFSFQEIETFLNGKNSKERVIAVNVGYEDAQVQIISRTETGEKKIEYDNFFPFVWATFNACNSMCGGDREKVKTLIKQYNIGVKKLAIHSDDGHIEPRMKGGYKFIFKALTPMSQKTFNEFFDRVGTSLYRKSADKDFSKDFLKVSPQEQYMIESGVRLFKGYDTYDELYRLFFDLETEGLDPQTKRINQIGIRTNRGFEKILSVDGNTKEEKDESEKKAIDDFLRILYTTDTDTVVGHNIENFDWNFIIERSKILGYDFEKKTTEYLGSPIYKSDKENILKLGGEVESFFPTIVPERIVLDSLHAARRAQASDSNMLKADLKYVTKYLSLNKPNRVYVPGDKIDKIWRNTAKEFAFNDENGDWYHIGENHQLKEGYNLVSGKYVVERYLLDDLWETDKVEKQLNEANFLINKIVPTGFARACTMGTAGIWKLIILAWSYEQELAIPMFGPGGAFTGGLSRLCSTGYVNNVIKLDYNSLYPSIMLTWHIDPTVDIQGVLPAMLEYVLTQREKYKALKKEGGKNAEKLREEYKETKNSELLPQIQHWENVEMKNDRLQNPLKILGNSAFGSFGAENLFPLGSKECAERITCTGRQSLRLMISWFMKLGYQPIVGDTDGFNFKLPDSSTFRYTKEHPYIGKGLNREVKEGKEYIGFAADVAEFNDTFMSDKNYDPLAVNKMGLGIDEVVNSTINFSRKNYADYFPENPYPKDVKLVGNTVKSKKMPGYIATFLDRGIRLLLQNKGNEFLDYYYGYIEKIYNYQIPLKEIASKGKIKKSIAEYIKDCSTLTKTGHLKSRQAWYELCIKNGITPDIGETIYYINTGKKKSESDIKRVTKWYDTEVDMFGKRKDVTKEIELGAKNWLKVEKNKEKYEKSQQNGEKPIIPEIEWMKENKLKYTKENEIVFASELLDRNILDSEKDVFCEDIGKEYNVAKYIDMFNKRITPLLVCFSKDIRNKILITNPSERQYFTKEESRLVSGQPNNPGDQDLVENVLKMEDREIKFWLEHPQWTPPFTKECGMDWPKIVADYKEKQRFEIENNVAKIREKYQEYLASLSKKSEDAIEKAMLGELPKSLSSLIELDKETNNFVLKIKKDIIIGNIADIAISSIVDDYPE